MNPLDKGEQMPCLRHVLNIFVLDIFNMIVSSQKLIENCQKEDINMQNIACIVM